MMVTKIYDKNMTMKFAIKTLFNVSN